MVWFMASRQLTNVLAEMIAGGWAEDTPAVYVASASTPRQVIVRGTIACLPTRVRGVDRSLPALLIVGTVARSHSVVAKAKAVGMAP